AWTCVSPTEVACTIGSPNECGGLGALEYEGAPALPGEPCAGGCRDGVLVCEDGAAGGLGCEGAVPLNPCGGCALLPDAEEPCGVCGGEWVCDLSESSVDYICEGPTPNACGGCAVLSGQPGTDCGEGGVVVCSSSEAVTCDGGGGATNPCGGLGELRAATDDEFATGNPGDACGDCEQGTVTCEDFSTIACRGDGERNSCGGCERLSDEPASPCGDCGDTAWQCEGLERVACGSLGVEDDARGNECGGCGDLHGQPGNDCGVCYAYECLGTTRLQCLYERDDGFCTAGGDTCEELNCEGLLRECMDGVTAFCGDCLAGYVEVEGQCLPAGACDEERPCPEDQVSEPSDCLFDEPCGEQSVSYTTFRSFQCVAGSCRSRLDVEASTQECPARNTEGLDVTEYFIGGPEPVEPGAPDEVPTECLPVPADPCSGRGNRVDYKAICRDGRASDESENVACELGDVDGWECSGGVCEDGECLQDARQPIGDPCRIALDCVSGHCSRGICAPEAFVTIPAGTFVMGSQSPGEVQFDETPARQVTISNAFFMLAAEMPAILMRELGYGGGSDDCDLCPARFVTWGQAIAVANLYSAAEGLPLCYTLAGASVRFSGVQCAGYRLPTEAEWEYAARAGSRERFFCGDSPSCLLPFAGPAAESVESVLAFDPSPWGLWGIVGGVSEWVWDVYDARAYQASDGDDPLGPETPRRLGVTRGCAYYETRDDNCRHSRRYSADPSQGFEDVGFRLVRTVPF
ncbi:MAG: hypothetical protein ACI81R_000721, partial [Bradymonadia bacterium]